MKRGFLIVLLFITPLVVMAQQQGEMWGTSYYGGYNNRGAIFSLSPDAGEMKLRYSFPSDLGGSLDDARLIPVNGKLCGMVNGVLFQYDPVKGLYTTLDLKEHIITPSLYGDMQDLTEFKGKLYGMLQGRYASSGYILEWNPANNEFNLKSVDSDGTFLLQGWFTAYGNKLYGVTTDTSTRSGSIIFEWEPATSKFTKRYALPASSSNSPRSSTGRLVALNGKFYGATQAGGKHLAGNIFEWDPISNVFAERLYFGDTNAIKAGNSSTHPLSELTLGSNGMLYGISRYDARTKAPTIFRWDPASGIMTKMVDLPNANIAGLTAYNGKLYGTTAASAGKTGGTLFEMYESGGLNILQEFSANGEYNPRMGVTVFNGKLYSATFNSPDAAGALFEYDLQQRRYRKLYDMASKTAPAFPITQLCYKDGKLYGVSTRNQGSLYAFDPETDSLQLKYTFTMGDSGYAPFTALTLVNNKFYGLAGAGGKNNKGVVYEFDPATSRYRKAADLPANQSTSAVPTGGPAPLLKDGKLYFTHYTSKRASDTLPFVTRLGIFEFDPANGALTQKASFAGSMGELFLYQDSFYIRSTGGIVKWETGRDSVSRVVSFLSESTGSLGHFGGKSYAYTDYGIYEISIANREQRLKVKLDTLTGSFPIGGLTYNNGKFYGMTTYGGTYKAGTIIAYNPVTSTVEKKQDFDYINGYHRKDAYTTPGYSSLIIAGTQPAAAENHLKVLTPRAGDTVHKPKPVRVTWTDKMTPSLGTYTYPSDGGKRAYSYRIDYMVFTPTSLNDIGSWVPADTVTGEAALNSSIELVSEFVLDTASKYTRVRVVDNYLPLQEAWSGTFVNTPDLSGLNVVYEWDRSFPSSPVTPVGVAADGTGSIVVKVSRKKNTDPPLRSLFIKILSADHSSPAMLGKVRAASSPFIPSANGHKQATTTTHWQDLYIGKDTATFMYVAPDDFSDGKDSRYATQDSREVTLRIIAYYFDAAVDSTDVTMKIVRPPLMLVHGLASNEAAWDAFAAADGTPFIYNNLYKIKSAIRLSPHAAFSANAKMLLGINQPGDQSWFASNTLQGNIQAMRNLGYACNQVDYICHSMGGAVLRTAATLYPREFKPENWHDKLTYFNYNRGFVHKAIFINTPHNGSPVADALTEFVPQASPYINIMLSGWYAAFPNTPYVFDFIAPSAPNDIVAPWRTTPAVYDLQASASTGGKQLGLTNINNHLIAGDIDMYSETTASVLRDLEPYFELIDQMLKIVRDYGPAAAKPYLTGLMALNKVARVFGFIEWYSEQKGFPNFLPDGDAVVPLNSQLAGLAESAPNTTIFKNSSFLNANHLQILSRNDVGERVRELLNSPVSATLFSNKIPANPGNNGKMAPPKIPLDASHYRHAYDTLKIRITAPTAGQQLQGNAAATISFRLKDTAGLVYTDVAFQFESYTGVSRNPTQNIPVTVKPAATGRQLIIATAVYDRNGETESHSDTLSVAVSTTAAISAFRVSPDAIGLRKGEHFTPQLKATTGGISNDVSFRDPALSISLSDSSLLHYNTALNQFIALAAAGKPYAVFTYRDRKDTLQFNFTGNTNCDVKQALLNSRDTLICGDNSIALIAPSGFSGYLWSDGSTGAAIQAGRAGRYWVQVTDSTGCSTLSDQIVVDKSPAKPAAPSVINGDANSVTGKKSDFSIATVEGASTYKWSLSGGGVIESGNGSTAVKVAWTTPGKYRVWAQAQNRCGTSEARQFEVMVYSVITATDDVENDFAVQVAPNPATTHTLVSVKGVNGAAVKAELTGATGNRVYYHEEKRTGSDYSHKVPLAGVPAGTYILKLTIGKQIFTEKIIKL